MIRFIFATLTLDWFRALSLILWSIYNWRIFSWPFSTICRWLAPYSSMTRDKTTKCSVDVKSHSMMSWHGNTLLVICYENIFSITGHLWEEPTAENGWIMWSFRVNFARTRLWQKGNLPVIGDMMIPFWRHCNVPDINPWHSQIWFSVNIHNPHIPDDMLSYTVDVL